MALQNGGVGVGEATQKFRPAGSPAGSWPHTPWSHCVWFDPYERVNFWSHSLPGLAFLLLGVATYMTMEQSYWQHNPLSIFCFIAAATHLASATGHVWPDNHRLEKLDHIGIVLLIVGTPGTALMAHQHGAISKDILATVGCLLSAAFLPPVPRTLGFTACCAWMVFVQHPELVNANLGAQLVLYGVGACAFIRSGGHGRPPGCTDHHLLHYVVTLACCLHVHNLLYIMAS